MTLSNSQWWLILQNAKDANTFSQLTYLLHVISCINLNDKDGSGFQYGGKARDEASESSQPLVNVTLLDSIVAILVQRYEVVVACYTSDIVSVVVAETDPNPSKVTDLDDFATDLDDVPSPDPHTYYPFKLAAVSNPDFNSSGFECESQLNANLHNLQIQTTGENLWTRVRDTYKWYCVFM